MNDLASSANTVEAILWFLFTAVFVTMACRTGGRRQRLFFLLSGAFLAFGISDLIEAQTGAWWRPLWLLLLKAACIGVFGYGVWEYQQIRRKERNQPPKEDPR